MQEVAIPSSKGMVYTINKTNLTKYIFSTGFDPQGHPSSGNLDGQNRLEKYI